MPARPSKLRPPEPPFGDFFFLAKSRVPGVPAPKLPFRVWHVPAEAVEAAFAQAEAVLPGLPRHEFSSALNGALSRTLEYGPGCSAGVWDADFGDGRPKARAYYVAIDADPEAAKFVEWIGRFSGSRAELLGEASEQLSPLGEIRSDDPMAKRLKSLADERAIREACLPGVSPRRPGL